MPKRKRSSDYCNAKRQKERIAAETSNERRVRLSAVRQRRTLYRGASSYDCNYDCVNNHGLSIGDMSVKCEHCGAMKFMAETSGMCCNNGKVVLPLLTPLPEPLASLLVGSSSRPIGLMAYYGLLATAACSTLRLCSFNHNMVI